MLVVADEQLEYIIIIVVEEEEEDIKGEGVVGITIMIIIMIEDTLWAVMGIWIWIWNSDGEIDVNNEGVKV